ncbi:helix-turn-helix domain-containing protein, partial [Propionibacteriaceae bacterium G57]|uniref:helix-turn-helix domain-containing protein n=1 Tax=Aestuariimicrobium sp. G57 TaxID=3418485 RepID=UPI003DA73E1D
MSEQRSYVGMVPVWTLADRMRKAREVTGLDQQAFSEELGVSRSTVSNAERGKVQPSRLLVAAWAMRSGVPLVWLETGSGGGGG